MLPMTTTGGAPPPTFSISAYLNHILKRIWLIILIVLIGVSLGVVQVARTRPLYRASARVLVQQKMMSSAVTPFHNPCMTLELKFAFHQTQLKLLKSRSLAREVISTLKLEQHSDFAAIAAPQQADAMWSDLLHFGKLKAYLAEKGQQALAFIPPTLQSWLGKTAEAEAPPSPSAAPPNSPPAPVETQPANRLAIKPISNTQIALTNAFLKRLTIKSDFDSSLYNLRFESHDPKLAAMVPNTLAEIYIDQIKHKQFEEAHEGINWLQKQVKDMEEKVEQSEIELERHKQEHNTYSIDDQLPGLMQQLIAVNTALTTLQTERIKLGAVYKQIQHANEHSDISQLLVVDSEESTLPEHQDRYDELQLELEQLENKYGPNHPKVVKVKSDLDAQQRKLNVERQRLLKLAKTRYEIAQARESALLARHDELKGEAIELNEKSIRFGRLKRKVESNQRLAKVLIDRLGETDLNMKMMGGIKFELVDPAEIPSRAINYQPARTVTMAGIVGLVLAVGLAVGLGYLDNRLVTPDDTHYLGFPVIGNITRDRALETAQSKTASDQVIMLEAPYSPTAEAYRMLRTNVLFSYSDPPRKVFLVTSSHPNEGKTTISANLAFAMSQMDLRVLLVDADLRNSSIHKIFNLEDRMGLSTLLLKNDYEGCILPYQDQGNLSIVSAGEPPPNPSELLGSKRMRDFLAYARQHYDVIVVDTPPLLAVSDALVLSPLADGILMVIRSNRTSRHHVQRAITQLLTLHSNLPVPLDQAYDERAVNLNLGLVMNFLDPRMGQTYGYYSGYGAYYNQEP